jgi:predicted GIY-YIG superfamily endonuclease
MFGCFRREEGMQVGDTVYFMITPDVKHRFATHYRPKKYFILATRVLEVLPEPVFDTYYIVNAEQAFEDIKDAKASLIKTFNTETDGTLPLDLVRLVSHEEEASANSVLKIQEATLVPAQ